MVAKAKAKQSSFNAFIGSRKPPKPHEYLADFTTMQIGHMAGDGLRVIRCPVCSRNCIGQEQARRWRFVHSATIQSTPKTTTWEPTDLCTMPYQQLQSLRDLGIVQCNRLGQILSVK